MAEPGETSRRAERRVGQTFGKYRIERVLGAGGMATVYLAVHRNGHKVALKVLSAELGSDDDMRARFVREGYAANSIDHPGVVRVIDDDVADDGAPFLVMELLEGETVHGRLTAAGGVLSAREVLALAYQLLDVLAVAHARGTIHRDLKPDNLFLTHDGTLKVLDFGIARIVMPQSGSDPTRTGRAMGTPAYMAPEQAFGKTRDIDARTDLWSVGATLFTLLSGCYVHEAENAAQLVVFAATRPARPLRSVAKDVPEEVAAIVDRACAYERADRWQDARSMQRAVSDAYRRLFGADVASARVSGRMSKAAVESAPTLDVSGASLAAAEAPRAPPSSPITPARRQRRLLGAMAAGLAVIVLAAGAALAPRVRAPSTLTSTSTALAPSSVASTACRSSRACGPQSICRAGACAALASVDCSIEARPEDVGDDSTVWIGAMFPTQGPMADSFDGALRDVELGRRDFLEVESGLPSPHAGSPPRPIGLVLCDDSVDPMRAARHLVDDLGLPAIIGFARSKEVSDLAASLLNPRRVLGLASNTAAMLTAIPAPPGEPRMVWRTTISTTMNIAVQSALVSDVLEPDLRAHGLPASEPLRVAFTNVDNTTGMSNADAIVASLRFNGRSAADNGESFRQFVVHDGPPTREEAKRIAVDIAAFRPHVVLDAATDSEIVGALESAWQGGQRPRYVVSSIESGPLLDAGLAPRVLDVEAHGRASAEDKLQLRYGSVFDRKTMPTKSETGGPYDAFYTLAYAMLAVGDAPVTGPSLARAFARLARGEAIDVGPGGILQATAALQRGESIDLEGVMTLLDFDPRTGDPTVDLRISCVRNGRTAVTLTDSGLRWDRTAKRVTGTLGCR
jgi:eukaryotic-like serine/threonine-protein kinase